MRRLTATEAARRFSELLDQVESDGESFVVERRGRPVASIAPVAAVSGRAVKALLRAQQEDREWAKDLVDIRRLVQPEARRWND